MSVISAASRHQLWIASQANFLRKIAPPVPAPLATVYDGKGKAEIIFGSSFLEYIRGKTVLDFGCGEGREAVEMALAGAKRVIGLDCRQEALDTARRLSAAASVAERCEFVTSTRTPVDAIVSLDAFEHFDAPETVLKCMHDMLLPGGMVFASWGPPWYHPYGAHLIELPPWTHVLFAEEAVMKWRSEMRTDGARFYCEVEGGLNQMTVARFERMVAASSFSVEELKVEPIHRLKFFHCKLTREFTTSVVVAKLRRPS